MWFRAGIVNSGALEQVVWVKQDTCKMIGYAEFWWARKTKGSMISKAALMFALYVTANQIIWFFSSGTEYSYFYMNLNDGSKFRR